MNEKTDYGFKSIDLIVISDYDLKKILKLISSNRKEDTEKALSLFEKIVE